MAARVGSVESAGDLLATAAATAFSSADAPAELRGPLLSATLRAAEAKLGGDLESAGGFDVAALVAADAAARALTSQPVDLARTADDIGRALAHGSSRPELAGRTSARVARYASVSARDRAADKRTLRAAIAGLGAPGEAPSNVLDDVTDLADVQPQAAAALPPPRRAPAAPLAIPRSPIGMVDGVASGPKPRPRFARSRQAGRCVRGARRHGEPELRRTLAPLGDVRQRIVSHPALPRRGRRVGAAHAAPRHAALRRARLRAEGRARGRREKGNRAREPRGRRARVRVGRAGGRRARPVREGDRRRVRDRARDRGRSRSQGRAYADGRRRRARGGAPRSGRRIVGRRRADRRRARPRRLVARAERRRRFAAAREVGARAVGRGKGRRGGPLPAALAARRGRDRRAPFARRARRGARDEEPRRLGARARRGDGRRAPRPPRARPVALRGSARRGDPRDGLCATRAPTCPPPVEAARALADAAAGHLADAARRADADPHACRGDRPRRAARRVPLRGARAGPRRRPVDRRVVGLRVVGRGDELPARFRRDAGRGRGRGR